MKKMLFSLMATALIVFAFSSCEKDLYEDGLQNSSRAITIKHISMSDLDKTISSRINEKIVSVKKMNKSDSTTENRFEYDSSLGMYIDTENGRLIDNNGELSYTFPMFRDSEEHLENIIFKPISNGEIETYVSKYNVKPEEFVDLTYQEISTLEPQLQKMSANGWYIVCVESQTQTGVTPIDNGDLTGNFGYEPVWETTGTTCYFIDNSGSSPTDFPIITSNGTTGNNGGGTSSTGVSTSPTGISPEQLMMKSFVKNLTDEQEDWYVENPDAHESIQNYLEENVFSEQSKEFVKKMINFCIANNTVFVISNVSSTNSITINNTTELAALVNEDCNPSIPVVNSVNDGDEIITTASLNIHPFYSLNVFVKQKLDPYSIVNVTSDLTGVTLGIEWSQTDYSVSSSPTSPSTAVVHIYGTSSYSLFIEGIGTYLTKKKHYKLLINKSDGTIFGRICD